jgi:hypothetical protein
VRRRIIVLFGLLVLVGSLGVASYHRAWHEASALVGPLPPGVLQFRSALIPLGPVPYAERWGWVISYGPEPGDAHAQLYVSPWSGRVIGANPPDFLDRMRARQAERQSGSRPTT